MTLKFDTSGFDAWIAGAAAKVVAGAERGMHDATDDLLEQSSELAPKDKGILRASAWKEVEEADGTVIGEVYYSTVEDGPNGRVNYALITHEMGDAFANPTTPGTQPKYLEQPLKMYADEYVRWIAAEIRKELK